MKKNIILGIIIALLVICVVVEGIIIWKQNVDKNKEEGKDSTSQVEETPSPVPSTKPKELPKNETMDGERLKISKKYSNPNENELVYTYLSVKIEDKSDNNHEYEYEIPQINIESKEVEKINKKILNKYEKIIDEMNNKQYLDLSCEGLTYEYYENDGILSLVMVSPTESGGYFECEIYNIEISTGEEIDNDKLLEKINISEEDLKDKMLKTIDNLDMYKSDASDDSSMKSFKQEQKDKTKYKYETTSVDKLDLYLNDDNHVCTYMEVHSIAGGETTTMILDLETNEII